MEKTALAAMGINALSEDCMAVLDLAVDCIKEKKAVDHNEGHRKAVELAFEGKPEQEATFVPPVPVKVSYLNLKRLLAGLSNETVSFLPREGRHGSNVGGTFLFVAEKGLGDSFVKEIKTNGSGAAFAGYVFPAGANSFHSFAEKQGVDIPEYVPFLACLYRVAEALIAFEHGAKTLDDIPSTLSEQGIVTDFNPARIAPNVEKGFFNAAILYMASEEEHPFIVEPESVEDSLVQQFKELIE